MPDHLCADCTPIGTWLLQTLTKPPTPPSSEPSTTPSTPTSLNLSDFELPSSASSTSSPSNPTYPHKASYSLLLTSAANGCRFCSHLSAYLRNFSEDETIDTALPVLDNGFIKRTAPFAELERNGRATNVELVLESWEPQWEEGEAKRVECRRVKISCGEEFKGRDRGMDVYVLDGNPLVGLVDGLSVRKHQNGHALNNEALSIMKKWIEDCVDNHEVCRGWDSFRVPKNLFPKSLLFPKRLVDVGGGDGTELSLVDSEDVLKRSGDIKYISLSHRWGEDTEKSSTTTANIKARRSTIDPLSLSANFQDAITTTRKLGVRYLWIDSICITQDDDQDWEAEAPRMAEIYMNSLLTISAEGPGNRDPRFLRNREVACALPYEYDHPSLGHIEGQLWVEPLIPQFNFWVEYNTLRDRGWILQERFFPSRILHFSPYTTFWECRTQVAYEAYPDKPERKRMHSEGFAEVWHTKNTFSQLLPLILPTGRRYGHQDTSRHYETWKWIVEAYSRTVLSWDSDRFPAISGMASHFKDILRDTYHAGLWWKEIPSGLCWEPSPTHTLKRPDNDAYQAPSWSWASLNSPVGYHIKSDGKWESRIKVVRVTLEPKATNSMGQLISGSLELRGKMIRCEVSKVPNKAGFVTIVLNGKSVNLLDVLDEGGMRDQVWCLWLMEDVSEPHPSLKGQQPLPHGRLLLLDEVDGKDNTYRRVGIIMFAAGLPHWSSIQETDIIII